jgi:hypothetical protein
MSPPERGASVSGDAAAAVESYASSLTERIAASKKAVPGCGRPCLQLSQLVASEMPDAVRSLHARPSDVMRAFPARFFVTRSFACAADEETGWVSDAYAAAQAAGSAGVALSALPPCPPAVAALYGGAAAALAAWPSEVRLADGQVTVAPAGPGAARAAAAVSPAAPQPASPAAASTPRRPLPSPRTVATPPAGAPPVAASPRAGLPSPRVVVLPSGGPTVESPAEAERQLALCSALRGARGSPAVAELLARPAPSWGDDTSRGWRYVTLRYDAQATGLPLLRLDRVWVTLDAAPGRWAAVVVALAAGKRGRSRAARTAVLATDPLPRDGAPAQASQPAGSPAVTLLQRLVGADATIEALETRLRGGAPGRPASSRGSSQASLATVHGSSDALASGDAAPKARRRSRRSGRRSGRDADDGAAASPERAPAEADAAAELPPVPSPASPPAGASAAISPAKPEPAVSPKKPPQAASPAKAAPPAPVAEAAASKEAAPEEPEALPDIVPSAEPEGEESEGGGDDESEILESATETEDDEDDEEVREGDDAGGEGGSDEDGAPSSPPPPRAPRQSARPPRIPSWDLHDADAPDDE